MLLRIFPAPITLFLAAPLALDRMIKVVGTASCIIAQTLEPPPLFQRFFPADWSTILLRSFVEPFHASRMVLTIYVQILSGVIFFMLKQMARLNFLAHVLSGVHLKLPPRR